MLVCSEGDVQEVLRYLAIHYLSIYPILAGKIRWRSIKAATLVDFMLAKAWRNSNKINAKPSERLIGVTAAPEHVIRRT